MAARRAGSSGSTDGWCRNGHRGARFAPLAAAAAMAVALTGVCAGTAAAAPRLASDVSIVRLAEPPLAVYGGGTSGLPATAPSVTGKRLDARSSAALAYRRHLGDVQARVVARAERAGPRIDVVRSYRVATAGFVARLTERQIEALREDPRVAAVEPNLALTLDAVPRSTPPSTALGGPVAPQSAQLMGLPDGLWAKQGGPIVAGGAGAGQVVGVLDTGIDPTLPSFAASSAGDTVFTGDDFPPPPPSFGGTCEPPAAGQPPSAVVTCTNKVVAARWYQVGREPYPGEVSSPLDTNGHGTHVAGIAVGNYGVQPVIDGTDHGIAALSGIAPRAQLAVYKVCPSDCPTADLLAAFDDAIADGVDVINTSLGTTRRGPPNSSTLARLAAQAAGIPVAQSAGNAGPAADTVGQSAAAWWSLAVGSTVGGGVEGAMSLLHVPGFDDPLPGLPMLPIVNTDGSEAHPLQDPVRFAVAGKEADARLCRAGSLAGIPAGSYVLCFRGVANFSEKLAAVRDGGAGATGGVVFVTDDRPVSSGDTAGSSLESIMLTREDGDELYRRLQAAGGTIAGTRMATVPRWQPGPADHLYPGSSRGPSEYVPDLMPVSVTAPGVAVPAAYARSRLAAGSNAAFLTGTSMASPQVAGALALLRREHPDWTPDELRSALITTGRPVHGFALFGPPASLHEAGGGRIDPNRATDPGLVVASTPEDYQKAQRVLPEILGAGAPVPDLGPQRDPADLNVPNVVLRSFSGTRTVRRTVRSVADSTSTWSASVGAPAGWSVTATPSSFSLAPGERQTLAITVTGPENAAEMTTELVLTESGGGGRTLRLPIGARTVAAAAGLERFDIETTAAAGSFPVPPASLPNATSTGMSAGLGRLVTNVGFVLPTQGCSHTVAVPAGTEALLVDSRIIFTDAALPSKMTVTAPGGAVVRGPAPMPQLQVIDSPQIGTWTITFECSSATAVGAQLKVGLIGADGIDATVTPGTGGGAPILSWSGLPADGDYLGYVRVAGGTPRPDQLVLVHRRPAPMLTGVTGTVLDVAADDVGDHVMKVKGTANPSGAPTWMRVEYGPTTAYGESTEPVALGAGTSDVPLDVDVGTLVGGAVRHARVVLERRGQTVVAGDDVVLSVRRSPAAQTLEATAVTPTSATIRGVVDPNKSPTTARFLAGVEDPPSSPVAESDVGAGDLPVPVQHALTGLTPETTYRVQIVAVRDGAPAATGTVVAFTTPALPPDEPTPTATPTATPTPTAGPGDPGGGPPAGPGPASPGPVTPPPADPRAIASACAKQLVGKAGKAATISAAGRKGRLTVRLTAAKTLTAVRVELRRAAPCSATARPLARALRAIVPPRRRTTVALKLARGVKPGIHVLVVSGKQGRRAVRSAVAVTLK